MYNKNDICKVTIEDLGMNGEGIGHIDGYTLFVKDALPGDIVEAKVTKPNKKYAYARLNKIITPSKHRIEPKCPVALRCGGCQIQHLSYEAQLEFKQNKVKNDLERIGKSKDFTLHPIIGMDNPFSYRNKSQFPVSADKNGSIQIGFYAGRTHSVIETDHCFIGIEENDRILAIIKTHMQQYNIAPYDEMKRLGLVRHILIRKGFATGEIMVCIVINGNSLPESDKLIDSLKSVEGMTSISLNINKENTNVILGKKLKCLYGTLYITDMIKDVKFQISPLSFYQVNPVQTEKLYLTALEYAGLTGKETVWDWYCGIGTISLFLAEHALKVRGVEIIPEAIENAGNNAKLNGIANTEFYVGKAEEVLPSYYASQEAAGVHATADVIVVDPPRKGCDQKLLETIAAMQPSRVVYVSCDPATLARDVKYLEENGYKLKEAQPVDMFPMTGHVETVAALHRTNS